MPDYRITVERINNETGILEFAVDGHVKERTPCWEDPKALIPAKTYSACSTTIMASKKYRSVYIPDEQTGRKGIFVHPGSEPKHSDGCIVCSANVVSTIYDTVPRNGRNLTVVVKNKK